MIKEFIKTDEKYPFYQIVEKDLYDLIDCNKNFKKIILNTQIYAKQKHKDYVSFEEIKEVLAWNLFYHHGMNTKRFFKEVSCEGLEQRIYEDWIKPFRNVA